MEFQSNDNQRKRNRQSQSVHKKRQDRQRTRANDRFTMYMEILMDDYYNKDLITYEEYRLRKQQLLSTGYLEIYKTQVHENLGIRTIATNEHVVSAQVPYLDDNCEAELEVNDSIQEYVDELIGTVEVLPKETFDLGFQRLADDFERDTFCHKSTWRGPIIESPQPYERLEYLVPTVDSVVVEPVEDPILTVISCEPTSVVKIKETLFINTSCPGTSVMMHSRNKLKFASAPEINNVLEKLLMRYSWSTIDKYYGVGEDKYPIYLYEDQNKERWHDHARQLITTKSCRTDLCRPPEIHILASDPSRVIMI